MKTQPKQISDGAFMANFALLMERAKQGDARSLDVLNEAGKKIRETKRQLKQIQARKPQAKTFGELMGFLRTREKPDSNILLVASELNHKKGKTPTRIVLESSFVETEVELSGYRLHGTESAKKREELDFFRGYFGATRDMKVVLIVSGIRKIVTGFDDGIILLRREV